MPVAKLFSLLFLFLLCAGAVAQSAPAQPQRHTTVAIQGQSFLVNGQLTYQGRNFRNMRVEGLLLNSRMVQGIFDDANPQTRAQWDYPDGPWDPERNTNEFVRAMPEWKAHGMLCFTLNLQGGNPRKSRSQPWINSAFAPDGALDPAFMARLERILTRADELNMVVILGLFYFGQGGRLQGDEAVIRATNNAVDWLLERGYRNVLIEIANEIDMGGYRQPILTPSRCPELIRLVQERSKGRLATPAGHLLTSISLAGDILPSEEMVAASDYVLLHGNNVRRPARIREMVLACRNMKAYRDQPIVFNEDDHYNFEAPDNNFIAAVSVYASWGYFDARANNESFDYGYQSVPVNWGISSPRKQSFFRLLSEMTGCKPAQ